MKTATFAIWLAVVALAAPAAAQTAPGIRKCTQAELAAVISDMSTRLRGVNVESQTKLRNRLRELAKLKGWSDADTEEKGLDLLEDDETKVQDETASHLLGEIDRLGQSGGDGPSCQQIEDLKQVATQLVEVTSAKASHISAKLDTELKKAKPTVAAAPAPPAEIKPAAPAAQPPVAPTPKRPTWETQTSAAVKPNDAYVPPPAGPPMPPVTAAPMVPTAQFTADEIRAAGRGLFGSISAELAAVIEYVFKSYGQPTGYILGTEGGAALLAGLRYGEGKFVTKADGERKIYWQGPSVGYDFGLTGSRTMILIYGLVEPDQMLQRFGGIDGSAYLVGGAGVTLLKKGPVILAPIRTGLGLRLGANVGYLRFTPKPRFNPL